VIALYCAENRRAPFVEVFKHSAQRNGFPVHVVDPGATPTPSYERFARAYRHHSVNSAEFELACFKRYFAAQRDLSAAGHFIMADSDIVVQSRWEDMPAALHATPEHFVGSVGWTADGPEDDTSPHFSRWTKPLLGDFIDFLIKQYEQRPDELSEIYRQRSLHNARASISDMTLLALWVKRRGIPFTNSNVITHGQALLDHNISTAWTANGRLRVALGRKQLHLIDDRWSFISDSGQVIQAATLHLQGRYKIAAGAIAERQPVRLYAKSAYIQLGRTVRAVISAHARV
jgi:hypothetical protein